MILILNMFFTPFFCCINSIRISQEGKSKSLKRLSAILLKTLVFLKNLIVKYKHFEYYLVDLIWVFIVNFYLVGMTLHPRLVKRPIPKIVPTTLYFTT